MQKAPYVQTHLFSSAEMVLVFKVYILCTQQLFLNNSNSGLGKAQALSKRKGIGLKQSLIAKQPCHRASGHGGEETGGKRKETGGGKAGGKTGEMTGRRRKAGIRNGRVTTTGAGTLKQKKR